MSEPSQPAESQRRVVKIEVTKLFNQFNHVIELKPERVTVLHGPNGVGKTKLLEMVSWLLGTDEDLMKLAKVPFERLTLTFSDETTLEAKAVGHSEILLIRLPNGKTGMLEHRNWFHGERLPAPYDGHADMEARDLVALRRVNPCLFIQTQRLLEIEKVASPDITAQWALHSQSVNSRLRPERVTPAWASWARIYEVARRLQDMSIEAKENYSIVGMVLDQSYPRRVLAGRKAPLPDASTLQERLKEVEGRRQYFQRLGLLPQSAPMPLDVADGELRDTAALDEMERHLLAVYVQDSLEKFAQLDELAERLDLLFSIVNPLLRRKQLRIDPEHGLIAENDRGERLKLDQLSAGEQHLLVLHADLLLNMQANTLVLIDEPELGWHVTWQKKFLGKLLQIAELVKIDVIVATHSPFILGSRLDLGVALADDEGSVDEAQD